MAIATPYNLGVSRNERRAWVPLNTGGVTMLDLQRRIREDAYSSEDVRELAMVDDQVIRVSGETVWIPGAVPLRLTTDASWSVWRVVPAP